MLKLIDKKILAILRRKCLPIWTYDGADIVSKHFELKLFYLYVCIVSLKTLLRVSGFKLGPDSREK